MGFVWVLEKGSNHAHLQHILKYAHNIKMFSGKFLIFSRPVYGYSNVVFFLLFISFLSFQWKIIVLCSSFIISIFFSNSFLIPFILCLVLQLNRITFFRKLLLLSVKFFVSENFSRLFQISWTLLWGWIVLLVVDQKW